MFPTNRNECVDLDRSQIIFQAFMILDSCLHRTSDEASAREVAVPEPPGQARRPREKPVVLLYPPNAKLRLLVSVRASLRSPPLFLRSKLSTTCYVSCVVISACVFGCFLDVIWTWQEARWLAGEHKTVVSACSCSSARTCVYRSSADLFVERVRM